MAAVGLEPRTSRSGVRHSTTEPPRSPNTISALQEHLAFYNIIEIKGVVFKLTIVLQTTVHG